VLTLWGVLAPLVERLRPAKRTEPTSVITPRSDRSRASKKQNDSSQPALFVTPRSKPRVQLVRPIKKKPAPQVSVGAAESSVPVRSLRGGAAAKRVPMQERYDAIVKQMLQTYGVRVRKWRTSMSGVAWYVEYRDGSVVRLLESPKPKSPMSLAIFLHEIGHHAIGLGIHKPRCLEEYLAWTYAVQKMEEHGFEVTDRVKRRMDRSLRYAVRKAVRRGLRVLPPELEPYR